MTGQVLANFTTEFSPRGEMEIVCHVKVLSWKVFVDSMSNALEAGAGIVIITSEGIKLDHSFKLGFRASNNEASMKPCLPN